MIYDQAHHDYSLDLWERMSKVNDFEKIKSKNDQSRFMQEIHLHKEH